MREHPGETFIIDRRAYPDKAAYALAAHVRSGGYVAFRPAGSFDAWVERADGNLEVIAVYLGEAAQDEAENETVASTPALGAGDNSGSEDGADAVDPGPARRPRTTQVRAGDHAPASGQQTVTPAVEPELDEVDADLPGIIEAVRQAVDEGNPRDGKILLSKLHVLASKYSDCTEDRLHSALAAVGVQPKALKAGLTYEISVLRLLTTEFVRLRVEVGAIVKTCGSRSFRRLPARCSQRAARRVCRR